jgi:hypothetical protein
MKFPFVIKTLLATLIIATLIGLYEYLAIANPKWYFLFIPFLVFLITMWVQRAYVRIIRKNKKQFISLFMLFSFAKMLLYSMIILAYLFFKGAQPIAFALFFLVSYAVFTGLQVSELLQNKQDETTPNP